MKKHFIIIGLMILAMSCFVMAENYKTIYNAYTTKLDYVHGTNWSGTNCSLNSSLCNTMTFDYVNVLYGLNISGNLNMGNNNITNTNWVFAKTLNTTTLKSYDIQNVNDVNSSDAHLTNLYATNLESNLDGTGFNITAEQFQDGVLTIKDGSITGAIDFNGTGEVNIATVNTGQGDNELYAMNQNVRTTDAVTFDNVTVTNRITDGTATLSGGSLTGAVDVNATGELNAATLNTGQGDNELYAMDQAVRTTDAVTFAGLTSNGNVQINGNLTVVGTAIEANVTNMNVNGSIKPAIADTFDLGSSTFKWRDIFWYRDLNGSAINAASISTNGLTVANSPGVSSNLIPATTNTYYIGNESGNVWAGIFATRIGAGEFDGALNWTKLQNYPVACPANSAVTTIGDANTCTDGLYTYAEMASGLGNWSADKASYATTAYADGLGNWTADKPSYATTAYADGLGNWTADKPSYVPYSGASGNLNLSTKNVTANCLTLPNGGRVCDNSTCTLIYSPNGLTIHSVCN